ncbi:MAG: hypothetical protein RL021_1651, partial [Bacteroidota bacterium]
SSTDLKLMDRGNSPLLPQDGFRKNVSNTIATISFGIPVTLYAAGRNLHDYDLVIEAYTALGALAITSPENYRET